MEDNYQKIKELLQQRMQNANYNQNNLKVLFDTTMLCIENMYGEKQFAEYRGEITSITKDFLYNFTSYLIYLIKNNKKIIWDINKEYLIKIITLNYQTLFDEIFSTVEKLISFISKDECLELLINIINDVTKLDILKNESSFLKKLWTTAKEVFDNIEYNKNNPIYIELEKYFQN